MYERAKSNMDPVKKLLLLANCASYALLGVDKHFFSAICNTILSEDLTKSLEAIKEELDSQNNTSLLDAEFYMSETLSSILMALAESIGVIGDVEYLKKFSAWRIQFQNEAKKVIPAFIETSNLEDWVLYLIRGLAKGNQLGKFDACIKALQAEEYQVDPKIIEQLATKEEGVFQPTMLSLQWALQAAANIGNKELVKEILDQRKAVWEAEVKHDSSLEERFKKVKVRRYYQQDIRFAIEEALKWGHIGLAGIIHALDDTTKVKPAENIESLIQGYTMTLHHAIPQKYASWLELYWERIYALGAQERAVWAMTHSISLPLSYLPNGLTKSIVVTSLLSAKEESIRYVRDSLPRNAWFHSRQSTLHYLCTNIRDHRSREEIAQYILTNRLFVQVLTNKKDLEEGEVEVWVQALLEESQTISDLMAKHDLTFRAAYLYNQASRELKESDPVTECLEKTVVADILARLSESDWDRLLFNELQAKFPSAVIQANSEQEAERPRLAF
jgi:hypothetical protein